jgi:hypothetical protein
MARPSSYQPEYAEQAKKLCELGATDREIANFFKVKERTIYRWQIQFPDFCHALKMGKDTADERVERSLYRRALGYSHDAVHVSNYQGAVTLTPIIEHHAPDTTACIFWLKNRRPDRWRDIKAVEHDIGRRLAELAESDLNARLAQLLGKAGAAAPARGEGTTH